MLHFKLTNDKKIKLLQAFIYLYSILSLLFFFDLNIFIFGIIAGWFLWLFGVSMCLHKWSSHKTFEPKNRLIKWFLLFMGTICSLGSTIAWADTHRLHHTTSDTKHDPHRPKGSLWHKIKTTFFYFPTYQVNIRRVKDLTNDSDHRWFHRNYFKIVVLYLSLMIIIHPLLAVIPILYVLIGISWVTVWAHIPWAGYFSYRLFQTNDNTYNSYLWSITWPGEGLHNTHHANPGLWNNAILPSEFDISAQFIKLLGNPKERHYKKYKLCKGKDLIKEYGRVSEEIIKIDNYK